MTATFSSSPEATKTVPVTGQTGAGQIANPIPHTAQQML